MGGGCWKSRLQAEKMLLPGVPIRQKLKVGSSRLDLPVVWLGHDLKHPYPVWRVVPGCCGVVVNAYQMYERSGFRRLAEKEGLQKALGFEGPIFVDSGGFQLMTGTARFGKSSLLKLYRRLKPSMAAVLDIPAMPGKNESESKRRWRRTLENTSWMYGNAGTLSLVPVVHVADDGVFAQRCADLRRIAPSPPMICIGGLVPALRGRFGGLMRNDRSQSGMIVSAWLQIARLVQIVKATYPRVPVHVMGAGSLSTVYLLVALGVDSIDSAGWRIKAAYGAIQLPGFADRFPQPLTRSTKLRRTMCAEALGSLALCKCPECVDCNMEDRVKRLSSSFRARAIHNASVLTIEARNLATAIRADSLDHFVHDRLQGMPRYAQVFNAILNQTSCRRPRHGH